MLQFESAHNYSIKIEISLKILRENTDNVLKFKLDSKSIYSNTKAINKRLILLNENLTCCVFFRERERERERENSALTTSS